MAITFNHNDQVYVKDGNLGIGKADPSAPLHINGGSTNQVVKIQATTAPYVRFKEGGTDVGFIQFGTDTYISNQIAGTLNFRTNNTDKMTILSDGNVGIGTTSPGAKLDITTDHTSQIPIRVTHNNYNDWLIQKRRSDDTQKLGIKEVNSNGGMGFATADAVRMIIDSSGNVGIGTTSPAKKLDVRGGYFITSDGGTNEEAFVQGGNGYAYFGNYSTGKAAFGNSENWTTLVADGGNVGIGTTSPGQKLHIKGGFKIEGASTTNHALMQLNDANTFDFIFSPSDDVTPNTFRFRPNSQNAAAGIRVLDRYEADYISLRHNGSAGYIETDADGGNIIIAPQGSTLLTAAATGNVGIGTTSPIAKLHLSGTGSQGTQAWFGNGFVNIASYHYDFARVGFSVEDEDGADTGAGFMFNTRNTADSNWMHGYIYQPQDGGIAFGTGGAGTTQATEKVRITAAGNVGIGTTTPDAPLTVHSSTDPEIRFGYSSTQDHRIQWDSSKVYIHADPENANASSALALYVDGTSRLYIPDSGNVGIGTTSPGARLHVKEGVSNILIGSDDTYGANYSAIGFGGLSNGHNRIFAGYDGSSVYDDMYYAAGTGKGHQFRTNGSGDTKMIITSAGNVGIGTTSPSTKLHIEGASAGYLQTIKNTTAGGDYLQMLAETGDAVFQFDSGGTGGEATLNMYRDGTQYVKISADAGVDNYFNNGANVGIGTTSPVAKLHISSSTAPASGAVMSDGKLVISGADGNMDLLSTDDNSTVSNNIGFGRYNTSTGAIIHKFGITSWANTGSQGSNAGNRLAFNYGTNANVWSNTELMAITSGGNVGIGTASPAFTLDVNGKIRVGTVTSQSSAILISRRNGANIEFGHGNTSSGYYGTIGVQGNNGQPYFALSAEGESSVNTFTTRGFKGNVITTDGAGSLMFSQLTSANATGQSLTERMRIDSAGNVGIGTTSPDALLDVGVNNIITLDDTGSSTGFIGFGAYNNGTTNIAQGFSYYGFGLEIDRPNQNISFNSYDSNGATTGGTNILVLKRDGNVGIGTASPDFKLDVAGDIGMDGKLYHNGDHNTYIGFGGDTQTFRTGGSDRMTITNSGVGIGTTSPTTKLHVLSGTLNSSVATFSGANLDRGLKISTFNSGNNDGGVILDAQVALGVLTFATVGSEHMRIDSSGNVGIGTAAPTHKLHVNGNMRLTGALRDSNNATGSAGQVLSSTGSATDWVSLPASSTVYTPKVYNLNNSTNINSQGQKLVPDFGTLEIEGNTTVEQVSGSDTDFQVSGEGTGIYEVTYAVFYKNTGNQRTPLGTYLTLNGTAVNGSLMVNYLRANVTGGGNWSSCTNTFYVDVTDASHPMALCVRRADSTTAPSGISMVEPAGMAVKSTISFRRIS